MGGIQNISSVLFLLCTKGFQKTMGEMIDISYIATDFRPISRICRNIVFLSLLLKSFLAKKLGMCRKSSYLCRRKQVATASEGCGSAKLEQVRLCVRLALHLHRESN
jgi:hypothetical protein